MSSSSTPDGELDPFDGTQGDSGPRYFRGVDPTLRESRSSGIDPTLRETSASGSSGRQEWTGMGNWRIREKLGAGGEAELFVVGRDRGEIAILKAYVFEDRDAKRQPLMPDPEVLEAIRDLGCPGLVRILEHGIAAEGGCLAGRYCEVMEECEGQIQTQHWDDEAELLALVGQVAHALQVLHSRRIAHRDVKPANILIAGTTERVYKLGDYGIATFANRRSRLGRRDASPMYASPAQLSGLVSMTDDWWSLGMIVQESLMGRHPHAGKSPAEIQRSYVTHEFRPQVPRAVSDRWKSLLDGLLDYNPEKRWSHQEVLQWCEGGFFGTSPVGRGGVVSETVGWLERAWLFLEDGEFDSAGKYVERVLDREPKTGEAYWVKALAGLGVRRESDLLEHQHTLSGNGDYQRALRFGTAELKRRLEGFEADIQMRYWRHRLLTVFHKRDTQLRNAERERQRLAAEVRAAEDKVRAEALLKAEAKERQLRKAKRERQRLAAEVRAAEDKARVEALLKAEAKERQLRKAERQLRKEERWVRVECRSQVQERDEVLVKKVPTGEVDRVEVTEQETYWEEEVRPGGWFRKEVRTQVQKTRPKVVVKEVPRMKEVRRTIRRKGPKVMEWSFIDGLGNQIPRGEAYEGYDIPIVFIVPGSLIMGSPSDEPDRQPSEVQHIVTLTHPFALAQTPCTQAQWEVVMGGNPSMFKGAKRPVETVSWDEALEYCRKLTTKQQAKGILPEGWEWRLPTEAEWEYAARAETTGPRYGELNAIGWWDGNSGGQTHPVKQKAANAWGLYDMMGNVWEWCSDWSADYPTGSVTDPKGSSSGSYRVFRGGSWNDGAKGIRSAIRFWLAPGHRDSDLGFRPALSSVR